MIEVIEFAGRQNCLLRHCFVITFRIKISINFFKLSVDFMSVSHMP